MNRQRIGIVVATLVAAAVAGTALMSSGSSGGAPDPAPTIGDSYSMSTAPISRLPAGPATMIRAVAKQIAHADPSLPPLNPESAHVLRASDDQSSYLLSNDVLACLIGYGRQRYYACTPASVATSRTQALVYTRARGTRTEVEALLPDGTSDVRAASVSGETAPLDFANNLASGQISGRVEALSWTNPDGTRGRTAVDSRR
jgi:hypothetical protein